MPELPEVEVTRRQLEPLLVGRRVARVYTTVPSYFFLTPPAELRRRLRGRRFELLERIGKYLLARLDNGDRLLLHLGMTDVAESRLDDADAIDGNPHDAGAAVLHAPCRQLVDLVRSLGGEAVDRAKDRV